MPTTTVTLPLAQATRLAEILDAEIAATKNRLVSATLSKGDYHDRALPLAELVETDSCIRANLRRQGVA